MADLELGNSVIRGQNECTIIVDWQNTIKTVWRNLSLAQNLLAFMVQKS